MNHAAGGLDNQQGGECMAKGDRSSGGRQGGRHGNETQADRSERLADIAESQTVEEIVNKNDPPPPE
jgi:hypothetical protein